MMENLKLTYELTKKQTKAFEYLEDDETEEVLFGGGAGGGKSSLGCFFIIQAAMKYPETRYLIGRAVLKHLKESTAKTLLEMMKKNFKLQVDTHYKYNEIAGHIRFFNGSEIVLAELEEKPSDPDFDRIGSTEYTYAFLDEVSQISKRAKETVVTRLRYKHKEYNLKPKLFIATNPSKMWAYYEFYKPSKEKILPKKRKFVQALAVDNPYLPITYIETLKNRDKITRERLLYGNWEYDDDPSRLMDYDAITDLFTNKFVPEGDPYISADLAMQGRDKFIVSVWSGLRCKFKISKDKSTGQEIELDLNALEKQYKVPRSQQIADSDGMGAYLESYRDGMRTFLGNRSAFNSDEFANIRAECYFKLAELVNKKQIYIECEDSSVREAIIEELEQIKRKDIDKDDSKKRIVPKDDIKEMLGRSPDYADTLMMRMWFEVNKSKSGTLEGGEDFFG